MTPTPSVTPAIPPPGRAGRGPLRVLWLVKSLNHGGAERLLQVMASRVGGSAVEVEVAYVRQSLDALVPQIARHVPVHGLGARNDRDLSWLPRLRSLVRDRGIDIVHTHSPLTAAMARLAVLDTPHVYTEHNVWDAYHPWTRRANALSYHRNEIVLAVSQGVASSIEQHALRWRRPPVDVLYHGYDERAVQSGRRARATARRVLHLPPDALVLGTAAIFRPQKRHALMVDAFARVANERPDAHLVLIGGGPLESQVRAQVARAGLGDRVVITGVRDDVPALLPALDVFVLSSRAEGLPVSLLEAMAAGVPAVSTAVGGVPEVVEDGVTGLLVPPEDVEALWSSMMRLADPERRRRFARAGMQRAMRYSGARAWEQVQASYQRVLPGRRPSSQVMATITGSSGSRGHA